MKFPVLTDEQISEMFKKFEVGICDYVVEEAIQGKSESNDYIKLVVRVFDKNGTERTIYDFLVPTERMAWKVKHFFHSNGLGELYDSQGDIQPDILINKQGKADVISKKEKDKNGNIVERLRINDYIVDNDANDFHDDDIPF